MLKQRWSYATFSIASLQYTSVFIAYVFVSGCRWCNCRDASRLDTV